MLGYISHVFPVSAYYSFENLVKIKWNNVNATSNPMTEKRKILRVNFQDFLDRKKILEKRNIF